MGILSDEQRFWEPWVPEVGQRVRINASPECRLQPFPSSPMGLTGRSGHPLEDHGRTGAISWRVAQEHLAAQGHRYVVEFDEPVTVAGVECSTGHYAAIELEPLTNIPALVATP